MVFDVDHGRCKIKKLLADLARERDELEMHDAHYSGQQNLSYMAPEMVMKLSDRMRQVIIPWPLLVVDALEERLDIQGFRFGDEPEADEDILDIWKSNNLHVESHMAHVSALVKRRSYIVVGARGLDDVDVASGVDESIPLITCCSPLESHVEICSRSRRVKGFVKMWTTHHEGNVEEHCALYLPDSTSWWTKEKGEWQIDSDISVGVDEHGMGVVPVSVIVNKPRLSLKSTGGFIGASELEAITPLSDAACKLATDMMVGAEYHALPRRWVTGVSSDDFMDSDGNAISPLSRVVSNVWAVEDTNAKIGQFPESDLSNFHTSIKLLAEQVAAVAGLPATYLGTTSVNPASADALRAAETRLIKRSERRQTSFGGAWVRAMQLAMFIGGRDVDPRQLRSMETVWRDAATPTVAQAADAAVKKFQTKIVPLRQTREDLGYTPVQIERMEACDEEAAQKNMEMYGLGPVKEQATQESPVDGEDPEDTMDGGEVDAGDGADGGDSAGVEGVDE